MKDIFADIQNYIMFLTHNGYNISFSNFGDRFYPFTEKLLQHEIHLHSVCSYLKSNKNTMGMCVYNKARLSKCKIKKRIYSCCYAGVEEFVHPVYLNNIRIICIHISGYRGNLKRSERQKKKIVKLCGSSFEEFYSQLSTEKPTEKTVDSFIKPLEYMLISLYLECQSTLKSKTVPTSAEKIYLKSLQFINDNYMNDISAEIIADKIKYSASYLRSVFKTKGGISLQNKINEIRLENAKFLLLNTTLSVTDISFNCGFSDSNYFSVIFKKKYGISPLMFRKEKTKYL